MGKIDPRVKRTYRLLGDALVELILEKPYEQITIKEITERAEVAYITFFRHYDSIDELLMQVLGKGMVDRSPFGPRRVRPNPAGIEGPAWLGFSLDRRRAASIRQPEGHDRSGVGRALPGCPGRRRARRFGSAP